MAAQTKYNLTGVPFVLTTLALALCTFMEVLDFSIANVSVPHISGGLGVSDSEGTWVITLYMVGNAIVLPISGWLSEKIGPLRLIFTTVILFGISSWLCGMAVSFPMLCLSRFIQGAFSGPLIPMSQVLLVDIFPEKKKNMALAIWAMVALIGPIAGPIVGGWITESYSWRWIFYINIPVAAFSAFIIWMYLLQYVKKVSKISLDWIGLILLVIGITTLQIMLDRGRQLDWFGSSTIRILAVIACVCLSVLFAYEWTHPKPLIEVRLLKIRSFALGTLSLGLSFMVFFAPLVITPLWLENFMGYDPLQTGAAVATMGVLPFILAPIIGQLMAYGWQKRIAIFSFLAISATFFYFTKLNTSVDFATVAWSRFYLGIGLTGYVAPLIALSLIHIPTDKMIRASAILQFFRIFMSGVGTSLYTTIWNDRATFHHANIVSKLNQQNIGLEKIRQLARERFISAKEPILEILNQFVDQQAYMLATNDVMLISCYMMLGLTVLIIAIKVSPHEFREKGLQMGH